MHETKPQLTATDFPRIRRRSLQTLQMNLGYLCNIACTHCHVAAGPKRTELMDRDTIELAIAFLRAHHIQTLDVTGGSPEMNPHFRDLVRSARAMGVHVMDRCNPTILNEPGYEWVANFLAAQQVEVIASLPCYTEETVDRQRGKSVFQRSIAALKTLNGLGYGRPGSGLALNLVYNPAGPQLPPAQQALEADYRQHLRDEHGIEFNRLFTLANMPIKRFGSILLSKHQFGDYMTLLKNAYRPDNLADVMCRDLVSVDWRGHVYDCDFNQMLEMPLGAAGEGATHLRDLLDADLANTPIRVADHCYGCTAGQGSSCGGALSGAA
ncbi:arsenosugar biosynthesis radical SAM (seleno)protein ArsS [Salinisphaera sp. LB1]|uniref:arsenosugar biosynthesis radical SAM (seleno)protein ArsS n=1 Tax=Salinisphaera sp. LB1 TaxID=2183911 RepID=UPI000D7089E2|nr:arsenosugar biosynthesis radical SAM (seleno)protein ArsS [Salinisphaera sp. LB1]AWN14440.1 Radical SAM domain protein [Salinisphaera sp. LB1]